MRIAPKLPHWTASLGQPALILNTEPEESIKVSLLILCSLNADAAINFGQEPPSWMTSFESMLRWNDSSFLSLDSAKRVAAYFS